MRHRHPYPSLFVSALLLLLSAPMLDGCRRIEDGATGVRKHSLRTEINPSPGRVKLLARGKATYDRYCTLCHGADGQGYAADNAPSLVSSTFLESASTEFLRDAIIRGRPGTAMAGYGAQLGGPLSDSEISALIAYLRRDAPPLLSLPPDGPGGDQAQGASIYAQSCQSCHGTATQRSNAVHLANPVFLGTARPAFLRHAIINGRPGTPMKPWGVALEPKQIEDVIAYVRSMATPAPPLPPKGAQEVPPWGPIVINPEGGTPKFNLRDDRFASLKEVYQALQDKKRIVIVDARAPSDWLRLHITGSLPLPYYDLAPLDKLPNDGTWIIAYCACPHHASGVVVDALRARGIKTSAVLDEGVFAWQRAGYPVVTAPDITMAPAPPPLASSGASTGTHPSSANATAASAPSASSTTASGSSARSAH